MPGFRSARRVRAPFQPVLLELESRVVPSFVAARNFAAGDQPNSVAVGDFNGDGIPDLAVADQNLFGSGSVSVLLGTGDGSFQSGQTFDAYDFSYSVAVGDFNGDGLLDLAVASNSGVSVLLGNGDGSFQPAHNLGVGDEPTSIVVGDFNGDGILDLGFVNEGIDRVSVLLGNGDGSFQPARDFVAGTSPDSVAVGDFNGDGIPDLAVVNRFSNTVSVLLGTGDGFFQTARDFAAGTSPDSVAVGDFNGDGIPDLAVANYINPNGTVSVLLGTGDGSFESPRSFITGGQPTCVVVGDFNSDGFPDLALANQVFGPGTVSVLLGAGDGSFESPRSFITGGQPTCVVVGDFNSDGFPDLAVADGNDVTVSLGAGDGSFQTAPSFAAGGSPAAVVVGDFNGDGFPDLAVANHLVLNGTVSVLLGTSDGSFQPAQTFSVPDPDSIAVEDFNSDGFPDLIVANELGESVSVLLGNGDGSFHTARTLSIGSRPESVVVGDFNGDGILDIAIAGESNIDRGIVSVLLGNGDGSFGAAHSFVTGDFPTSVAVGDFNGDGILDLATANDTSSGSVSVLLGNGDGSFQTAQIFAVGDRPTAVAVGDFNGDGIPDLAVANYSGSVSVLLGNGDGSFQPARTFAVGFAPQSVAVGDFNGDGLLDLAVANAGFGSNTVSVLLGNGDGSFQAAQTYLVGSSPYSVAVGDFNGDGWPDVAVANDQSNDVSILINNGLWTTAPQCNPGGSTHPGTRLLGHRAALVEPRRVDVAFAENQGHS